MVQRVSVTAKRRLPTRYSCATYLLPAHTAVTLPPQSDRFSGFFIHHGGPKPRIYRESESLRPTQFMILTPEHTTSNRYPAAQYAPL